MAAASARLCVETKEHRDCVSRFDAAASARLCVETIALVCEIPKPSAAASARLCVETNNCTRLDNILLQPPPRGCVLKHNDAHCQTQYAQAAASARLCVQH